MRVHLPGNWWTTYLGKPWCAQPDPPHSYNCGELVRAVHRDWLGIDSPAIPVRNAHSRLQCLRAMQPELFGLEPLPQHIVPRTLDVAFLGRGQRLSHVGIAVDTSEGLRILHCPEAVCGVVLDSLHELYLMGFPRLRWFRHRGADAAMKSLGWLI